MDERNAPATKGDLLDLEARLNERHEMLRAEMGHMYNSIMETLRDVQTEFLKAFYTFAQASNKRMTEVEANEASLRSRMATMEDRITEVERRLNMPPTQ